MARQARIIDQITDAFGDEWDVREYRPTQHGFDVTLGWPSGMPRGRGGTGGPKVVVTEDLRAHLESLRLQPAALRLPIGATAIKRLRRLLGHHHQIDRAAWWEDRVEDLADLTVAQFCDKHGVSAGSVVNARHALYGPKLRPAGWWRAPDIAAILTSARPRAEIADGLGVSLGAVGRLRWAAMNKGPRPVKPFRGGKGLDDRQLAFARKGIEAGDTAIDIAKALEVSPQKLYAAIRAGYLPRPGHKGSGQHPDMVKAVEMVRNGATYSEAARTYGFTATGVAEACRKAGVESPMAHFTRRPANESADGPK